MVARWYGNVSVVLNARVPGPRNSSENPIRWVMFARGFPALPRFVLMMITPFAALEP